jgi:ABC-type uncharacterized transport system involved in gliding motility auxiliary subunit
MGNRKGWFGKRTTQYGTLMGLMILVVLGILVTIELFSQTRFYARADLTRNRRYSLAPQTVKVLEGLKEPVKAYAFFQEADVSRTSAEELFKLYRDRSKEFSFEFVDPDRFPLKAQNYKVTSYNTIALEQGDRFEKVAMAEEERITNALVKLIQKEKRVVYCLQGHGEHALDNVQKDGYSEAKKAMENESYEVKPLILAREQGVPEDATLLLIGGPQKDFQEEEWKSLKAYVEGGGRLLVLADPQVAPGMGEFLKPYGIQLDDDVIVDRASRLLGGDYLVPPIVQYEFHTITKDLRQSGYLVYLPLARSVAAAEKPPEGVAAEVLARTGAESWGERDLERLKRGDAEKSSDDIQGPVPVAVAAKIQVKEGKKKEARVVAIGDSDLVVNSYIDPNRSANQDLFLNSVNWLAEAEDLISIRAKSAPSRPLMLGPSQMGVIFLVVVVAFPLSILAVGVGVLWRRRKK